MGRLGKKKRGWESQDLNLSKFETYIQEAKMQVAGENLWFVEGMKILEFILYLRQ